MAKTSNPTMQESISRAVSPWLLPVKSALSKRAHPVGPACNLHGAELSVVKADNSLFARLRMGEGGYALRLAFGVEGFDLAKGPEEGPFGVYDLVADIGRMRVQLTQPAPSVPLLHWRTTLTPASNVVIHFWPRDVVPVDAHWNPLKTRGIVYATQRGPKAPLVFGSLTTPQVGSFLYMQDLTSLNELCEQMKASPFGQVGGEWPELGFSLPTSAQEPLKAGKTVTISDAFFCFSKELPKDHLQAARLFVEMFADIYVCLQRPDTQYHDWLTRARESLASLVEAPGCTTERRGLKYFNAYYAADENPPESMVQLSVLMPMLDYRDRRKTDVPLVKEITANLASFYNPTLGTLVRYLPGDAFKKVAEEQQQNHHSMDSWYLLHTLLNAGRLALHGEEEARRVFMESLPNAIKTAQHLDYHWPIFYDLRNLEVIRKDAASGYGETDVAGLYALVMLHAYDLTQDKQYVKEAATASRTLKEYGFELAYQFNSTIYGAIALARLWRLTGDKEFLDLSIVCLSNVLANAWTWQCRYGHSKYYPTFFGLPPLDTAVYIAAYEEMESLAALASWLNICASGAPKGLEMLLCEFSKYVLHRTWYAYPSEWPAKLLAEKQHDGKIDRTVCIPLEDVSDGWYKPGQVGQQVYGAGAPFLYAAYAYHEVKGAALLIFCDYIVSKLKQPRRGQVQFQVRGDPRLTASLRLIPTKGSLPQVEIFQGKDKAPLPTRRDGKDLEAEVRGGETVTIRWGTKSARRR